MEATAQRLAELERELAGVRRLELGSLIPGHVTFSGNAIWTTRPYYEQH